MGLRLKFNLVLFSILMISWVVVFLLHRHQVMISADLQTQQQAALIYQVAESIRSYNQNEVQPLLQQLDAGFLPQSVGSYAASQVFNDAQLHLPEFSYKVAIEGSRVALYQANVWQQNIINQFQDNPSLPVITAQLTDAQGPFYAFAKPIVNDQSVSGAKIVRINLAETQTATQAELDRFILLLVLLIVGAMVVLNLMVHVLVIKPLRQMAEQAELISQGQAEVDEIVVRGHDEISQIGQAFNRLQRSLKAAMSMLS